MVVGLDSASNSSIAFADVNADNSPDVVITGIINSGEVMTKGYFTSVLKSAKRKEDPFSTIQISPNPNKGENIVISGKEINSINIFNLQGQLITKVETTNEETIINLENKPKGIYLVKALFKNGNVVTDKLVIQ